MPNNFGEPEISVTDVAKKLQEDETFVLLDVREMDELQWAKIDDERVVKLPLSILSQELLDAIPDEIKGKDTEVVVFCHTGVRSAQVTGWFRQQGWTDVLNMTGGIDEYAVRVDPSVGRY